MGKKCPDCQNFVKTGSTVNGPFNAPVDNSLRNEEGLRKYFQSQRPNAPSRLRCQFDNWDSARIRNPEEIFKTITTYDASKCAHFSRMDALATPEAVENRDRKKTEAQDRKFTRALAIIAILISIASFIVSLEALFKS
jgi:hypothetical protein